MYVKTEINKIHDNELFKEIPNTEAKYAVSNFGRVLSIRKDKLLALKTRPNGYIQTCIRTGKSIRKHVLVHRLVAKAFCNRSPNNDVVNHLDNNTSNNHYSNLEWTTTKGNVAHAINQGRMNYQTDLETKKSQLRKGNETQIANAIQWKKDLEGTSLVGSTILKFHFTTDSKPFRIDVQCNSCGVERHMTHKTFKTHMHKRNSKLPYCKSCVLSGKSPKV